jgi:hypothetical protein
VNESKIERRYVGVQAIGRTSVVLEKIQRAVHAYQQTHVIPIIKIEKSARRQFYVFLAIEGVEGGLPAVILDVLKASGLTSSHFWPLALTEIKSMTSSGEVETHGFTTLSYKPLWDRNVGDPYDLSDESPSEASAMSEELQQNYDRLLYWLSATAEGNWEMFVHACKALQLAEDARQARRILRRLVLLGHIECAKDGSAWSVAPPVLVLYPMQPGVGFLCGQRTPMLLARLRELGAATRTPQPNSQGPARIEVACESLNEGEIELVAGLALHVTSPVAVQLAALLPNLDGWKETLACIERLNTTTCVIERWDGQQYASCHDFYQRDDSYFGASGLYRLTREATSYRMVLYFDGERQRWLKGDWYGLRFLAYKDAGLGEEPVYYSASNELRVLAAERWPLLYERALALASGLLPRRATDTAGAEWLIYRDVPAALTQALANKLSVTAMENPHA